MHAGILQKGEGEGEVMSMKYSKAIKKGIAYVLAICLTAGTGRGFIEGRLKKIRSSSESICDRCTDAGQV